MRAQLAAARGPRRRRRAVLPVAGVPGGRREVPLGDAAARRHRHPDLARGRRARRRAPPDLEDRPDDRSAPAAIVFDWPSGGRPDSIAPERRRRPARLRHGAGTPALATNVGVDIVAPVRTSTGIESSSRPVCTCCARRPPRARCLRRRRRRPGRDRLQRRRRRARPDPPRRRPGRAGHTPRWAGSEEFYPLAARQSVDLGRYGPGTLEPALHGNGPGRGSIPRLARTTVSTSMRDTAR